MKKVCLVISAIVHVLCIVLLSKISFSIKIVPPTTTIIDISLSPSKTLPQSILQFDPELIPGEIHNQTMTSPSVSGTGNGLIPAKGVAKSSGGWIQTSPSLLPALGKLNLKSSPTSVFSLIIPASGSPLIDSTFSGTNKTGKRFSQAKYFTGPYPAVISFTENSLPDNGVFGRIPFNINDREAAAWVKNVLACIERNWVVPTMARVGITGQVVIMLTIDHNGRQISLIVEKSSLQGELDKAALAAMKASLPFPPLPKNIIARTYIFHFVFNYNA